ncbi:MAG: ATP-binding cassette domain-containing protein [Planctomycetes bacterium]|nr:ATP-binding cassette domain-containing protein [Planctomycetota bacterium]
MSLVADIAVDRGPLRLRAELRVESGETVALVGPNGAGKTSLLLAIAGLLRIDRGAISLDGRLLDGGAGGPFVPTAARHIGVVFQQHLLLPHLSVLDNVAYGPRSRGRPRSEARAAAADWLDRVGVGEPWHDARPATLSGGQSQRVALARALATAPALLLLDEPLAAVDASARLELRRELRAHLAGFRGPRILVAHHVEDALALADRVVVLEAGRVVQCGTLEELVRCPRSPYVADLVGLNCFVGTCRGGVVEVGDAHLTVVSPLDGEVVVTVHPRAVSLFPARPAGSPRNVWSAPVDGLEPSLDRVRVRLGGVLPLVAEVTPAAVAELGLAPGRVVWVAIKATELGVSAR